MRKIVALFLAVLLLVPGLSASGEDAAEDGAKLFRVGEPLLLFEKDGLSVSLEGGIVMLDMSQAFPSPVDIRDENASVALTAFVENRTEKDLFIEYSGTVNGISLGENRPLINVHKLTPGSRNAVYIVFQKDWLNGADVRILQNCDLTFRVYEKPTNVNDDNIFLYEIPAGTVRFDRAPSAGLSFREGENLVILAQNGLQVSIVTVQVAKGSQYMLMGAKVLNNTGETVYLTYRAKINGWDIGGYGNTPMGRDGKAAGQVDSGTSVELIMPVTLYGWNRIRASAELESMELIFDVNHVDGSGNRTPWFTSSTGTIWINREAGTGFAESAAAPAVTEAPTAAPEPEKKEFVPMFGLAFGDSKAEVRRKIRDGGGSCYEESGALHGSAELFDLPNQTYDYLLSDNGNLMGIRNLCIMKDKNAADTESLYRDILAELTGYFGAPNGRGSTGQKRSVNDEFVEVMASFMTGPYYNCLHHDEWYLPDAQPYPLKIDLFYEDTGNRETGDHGITIEVDIEALNVK